MSDLVLREVAPYDIHKHWLALQEGLQAARSHDLSDPDPEHVLGMLLSQGAFLITGHIKKNMAGFIIAQVLNDVWTQKPERLHLWKVVNFKDHNLLKEGQSLLEDMARDAGLKSITFRSDKMSFERLVRGMGYRLREIELIKEL